jgi:hypothetical protein
MKNKYTPGQDCKCHAYSESECACDVDWTPTEVYELREQLKSERALADRLAEALTNPATYVALEALDAWKEARSE